MRAFGATCMSADKDRVSRFEARYEEVREQAQHWDAKSASKDGANLTEVLKQQEAHARERIRAETCDGEFATNIRLRFDAFFPGRLGRNSQETITRYLRAATYAERCVKPDDPDRIVFKSKYAAVVSEAKRTMKMRQSALSMDNLAAYVLPEAHVELYLAFKTCNDPLAEAGRDYLREILNNQ